jgi:hypothetical protein
MTTREKEIERKLEEGLRRQNAGLAMHDEEPDSHLQHRGEGGEWDPSTKSKSVADLL